MESSKIIIRVGEVVSTTDINDGGRIKVKVYPTDNNRNTNDIDYAYPLLPKLFHIIPKLGEAVLLLYTAVNEKKSYAYYIGPIIPQDSDMEYSPFHTARALYPDVPSPLKPAHSNLPDDKDAFCDKHDVALYGRKGCDVILKENDVRIRCGARIDSSVSRIGKTFNYVTPAYLKLKYYDNTQTTEKGKKFQSAATLVADEINLISNNGPMGGKEINQKDLINDKKLKEIIDNAHPLPYGDTLIEFLKYFLKMFQEHAHPYPGMPTILPSGNDKFWQYDLETFLSKNIRIN